MILPRVVPVHPWGAGGAQRNASHRTGKWVSLDLNWANIQRPKTVSKGREKPLTVISRWDSHSLSDTAALLLNIDFEGSCMCAEQPPSLRCNSRLLSTVCFTPCLHICVPFVAFFGANSTLREGQPLKLWAQVSPRHCRSLVLSSPSMFGRISWVI